MTIVATVPFFLFFNELTSWSKKSVGFIVIFASIVVLAILTSDPSIILVNGSPIIQRPPYILLLILFYSTFLCINISYKILKDCKLLKEKIAKIRIRLVSIGMILTLIGYGIVPLKNMVSTQYIDPIHFSAMFSLILGVTIFYLGFSAPNFFTNLFKKSRFLEGTVSSKYDAE